MTLQQRSGMTTKGKPPEAKPGEQSEEDCRCKEVSKKTLPELLKVVIDDLAFWKKGRIKR